MYSSWTLLRTFAIYFISLFSADHSWKKTGLENLKQSFYLCSLWFRILITPSNYQLYAFLNNVFCL